MFRAHGVQRFQRFAPYVLRTFLTSCAPSEAWCLLQGESPCRVRNSQPPVPSVGVLKETTMEGVRPEWRLDKAQNFPRQWFAVTSIRQCSEQYLAGQLFHFCDRLIERAPVCDGLAEELELFWAKGNGDGFARHLAGPLVAGAWRAQGRTIQHGALTNVARISQAGTKPLVLVFQG